MDGIKSKINPQDALMGKKLEEAKAGTKDPKKLKQAAKNFEAIFVNYMLQNMRKTIMKSGLTEDGVGGEIMLSMFDQKLSEQAAEHSGFGIAEMIERQLGGEMAGITSHSEAARQLPLRSEKLVRPDGVQKYLNSAPINSVSRYDRYIEQAAGEMGVDSNLVRSVIMAESSGNPNAVSNKNARGLMQLIDSTAAEMGVKNSMDPEDNIRGGTKYLAHLLNRFEGDTKKALAAYNAGPSKVEKYNGIPPYKETRQYVNRVLAYYRTLSTDLKDLSQMDDL